VCRDERDKGERSRQAFSNGQPPARVRKTRGRRSFKKKENRGNTERELIEEEEE